MTRRREGLRDRRAPSCSPDKPQDTRIYICIWKNRQERGFPPKCQPPYIPSCLINANLDDNARVHLVRYRLLFLSVVLHADKAETKLRSTLKHGSAGRSKDDRLEITCETSSHSRASCLVILRCCFVSFVVHGFLLVCGGVFDGRLPRMLRRIIHVVCITPYIRASSYGIILLPENIAYSEIMNLRCELFHARRRTTHIHCIALLLSMKYQVNEYRSICKATEQGDWFSRNLSLK